ncbi:MAG: tetratricopeptide repeat protein [Gemmatimonadales bacterium]|nr:tetratricopeptide repeat protein [Gemmatimonadales bacterium]
MSRVKRLIQELRRRRVFRVAVVYAAVAFVVWQAAEIAFPALNVPEWALTLIIVVTLLGFPIALVLGWAFDITPEGLRRTGGQESPVPPAEAEGLERVTPARKSIVVLPFDNMSPDPQDAYLSDGLTEEIITALSCCDPLRVISRTSARALKGTQKDIRTIARELEVQYVLEGSVRKAGNQLRITAQLIDAVNDAHVWAEKYSGTLEDVFEMQERISRSIVRTLRLRLTPDEQRRLVERPIDNVQAYECYLRARQESWLFTKEALDRAVQYLRNGLEIVGENAVLYAGLGYVYSQYVNIGAEHEAYIDQAEDYARKALELKADCAEAHLVLGFVNEAFRGDQRKSIHHYREALRINPDDPHVLVWLSVTFSVVGKTPEAYPLIERAVKVDPLTPMTQYMPGFLDLMEGRFERALGPTEQWFRMDPQNPAALFFYAQTLAYAQRFKEASRLVADNAASSRDAFTQASLLVRWAAEGDVKEMRELPTEDVAKTMRRDPQYSFFAASMFALAGLQDEAMDWLENAVSRGFINYPWLSEYDPFLTKLCGDPRFVVMLEGVKREWEQFEL